ncbi:MAG: GFA family protein [Nevskia sp.]|nr:GFA family protein [Nevskia sp.]
MSKELHGGCLCGAVEYAVADALQYARYCHCSECRRFSGSAFSAFGGVAKADFRLLKGAEHVGLYPKSGDTVLAFCRTCGSSLYADKPRRGMVHLRLGTLRDAPALWPQAHVHVASKAPWYEIGDDLPQYETTSR